MPVYKHDELVEMYEGMCAMAVADCTLTSSLVGGQPADDKGLEMFCRHHLKLDGKALFKAVIRIRTQEIGETEDKDAGELKQVESYAVNVLRHDPVDQCCFLGNWQAKAGLKQAASRLGLFVAKRGTKGDLAEMARVRAAGISLGKDPSRIRILNPDGSPYVGGVFEKFMGRVNTPSGKMSIVHDTEIVPPGRRFSFELRVPRDRLTEGQIASIFAALQEIGLGSARSLERGKFRIDTLTITDTKPKKA